jgi:hypothetical protein
MLGHEWRQLGEIGIQFGRIEEHFGVESVGCSGPDDGIAGLQSAGLLVGAHRRPGRRTKDAVQLAG